MATRTLFEKRILKEIQDIPEYAQEKLEKLIRFFKLELLGAPPEKERREKLLALAGSWEDDRSAEEIITEIHAGPEPIRA